MWPFTLATVNELADLIESHIYAGTVDEELAEVMFKAGKAGGRRLGPTEAVAETVRNAVESAGARLARESESTATSHHVEIVTIQEQAAQIAKRLPEIDAEARSLDEEALEVDASARSVLELRAEHDRHEPEVEQAGPFEPVGETDTEDRTGAVDLNRSMAKLKERRARAEAEALRQAELQRKADIRAKEAKRLDEAHAELVEKAAALRAEAVTKREEHARLKQQVADGEVRVRDLHQMLERLPVEARQSWEAMARVGEFLWSRYCAGYNYVAVKKSKRDASTYVSTDIDFEKPKGLGAAALTVAAGE